MTAAALSGDFLVPQGLAMVWGALGVRSCEQQTLSIMVQFGGWTVLLHRHKVLRALRCCFWFDVHATAPQKLHSALFLLD